MDHVNVMFSSDQVQEHAYHIKTKQTNKNMDFVLPTLEMCIYSGASGLYLSCKTVSQCSLTMF